MLKQVAAMLRVSVQEQVTARLVRGYGGRPNRVERDIQVGLTVAVDEVALAQAIAHLGWRVYATNQPQDTLPLEQAILATGKNIWWSEGLVT